MKDESRERSYTLGAGSELRVRTSASVYARAFEAELVLLDFGRGEYFALDEVGAEVWRGIESSLSIGEIADRVVARFEVARDVALDDVRMLVEELRREGLVAPC